MLAACLSAYQAGGALEACGPTSIESSLTYLALVRYGCQTAFEVAAQRKAWRPNHQGCLVSCPMGLGCTSSFWMFNLEGSLCNLEASQPLKLRPRVRPGVPTIRAGWMAAQRARSTRATFGRTLWKAPLPTQYSFQADASQALKLRPKARPGDPTIKADWLPAWLPI